jgi:WD40 repeat protein
VRWFAIQNFAQKEEELLFYGADDGTVACLDSDTKLLTSIQLETVVSPARLSYNLDKNVTSSVIVCCLESDGHVLFGGCSDGTIRCWQVQPNNIMEVYRQSAAHVGPVRSMSLVDPTLSSTTSQEESLSIVLASAGDDCAVRFWRINCAGDY